MKDYNAVDKLINNFYGLNSSNGYEMVAYEEMSNGDMREFDLDGKVEGYDLKAPNKLLETKKIDHFNTWQYLNYIVSKGELAPGTYLVDVFW